MASVLSQRPRVKPSRSIRVVLPIRPLSPGIVQITVGGRTWDYFVEAAAADFGRAFIVAKILGDDGPYHVNLDGQRSTCDCKGATLGRSGRCKHIDGLQALCDRNRL